MNCPSNEKEQPWHPLQVLANEKQTRQRGLRGLHLWIILVALTLLAFNYSGLFHSLNELLPFGSAKQQSGIAWFSCPDLTEYDCAYLSVPLDYTNPLPNETVSLALRRLQATAPTSQRLGTLFFNPGGPRGSGTQFIARGAVDLSIILKGRYDILSWDPSGINMTTPALDCYPTDWDDFGAAQKQSQLGYPYEVRSAAGREAEDDGDGAELAYFEKLDAYFRAGAASCAKNGNRKILESVSTAFVARDMKSILEALGEAERGMVYWGESYGTILGATFGAMFPELVHRVVLDGVSDSAGFTRDVYKQGKGSMTDTNKVYDGFLSSCAEAGPARCALAEDGLQADDIRARINDLVDTLVRAPLAVPFTGKNSGILTASDVQTTISSGLNKPKDWPHLAQTLAAAQQGDGGPLADLVNAIPLVNLSRRAPTDNVFGRALFRLPMTMAGTAVFCGETDPAVARNETTLTVQWAMEYTRELEEESVTGGRWWQFTVEEGLRKTKYPIVFLGNTADPVTPLAAARSMSKGFGKESATLLIQDGYGHCSIAHPSLCTARALAAYYHDGEVPTYGTVCRSDPEFLFPTAASNENRLAASSAEEVQVVQAMERLADVVPEMW